MKFENRENATLEIKIDRRLASAAGWLITILTQKKVTLYLHLAVPTVF